MSQPLSPWDSDGDHPNIVWRCKLDNRYLIEVQRTGERNAKLSVFDHERSDEEIASWDVELSYGAIFGPDVDDVSTWQEKVADFVDNTYSKQQ